MEYPGSGLDGFVWFYIDSTPIHWYSWKRRSTPGTMPGDFGNVFHLKYLWETPMLCGSFTEIKKGRSWRVLDQTLEQALSKILRVLQNLLPRVQGKRKMFVLSPGKSWGRLCVPMGRAGPALPDEEMKGEMPAKICTGVFGWCWASGPVFNTKIGWK